MKEGTILAAAVLAAAVMVGLGSVHPFGDPRKASGLANAEQTEAALRDAQVPPAARAVLMTKCADCHSDATHWPAYARLAPGSWLMERDVMEGRKHMNFSHWRELPEETRQQLEAKMVNEVKEGEMPLSQYTLLHRNARIVPADLQALSQMGKQGAVESAAAGANAAPGDAVRGKAVFEKRCTGCHALESDREGPRLRGVFGRKAGSVKGFSYSKALSASGITWDEVSLERWLSDTDVLVPQNAMGFSVPKAAERADLIAYLRQTK